MNHYFKRAPDGYWRVIDLLESKPGDVLLRVGFHMENEKPVMLLSLDFEERGEGDPEPMPEDLRRYTGDSPGAMGVPMKTLEMVRLIDGICTADLLLKVLPPQVQA